MSKEQQILNILHKHIPETAIQHCLRMWQEDNFKLIIKKKRDSKLGDYRFVPSSKTHIITLNDDLNKYAFLVTYLHEVAHLRTTVIYGLDVKPHGEEWKNIFRQLLAPFLKEEIFPISVLIPLTHYISDPKASSCSDIPLQKALRDFDPHSREIYLSEANKGDTFRFNRRLFVKEDIKRSRAICREVNSGRRYFISQAALVEQVGQTSLFTF
jgi:SprT protein